LPFGQVIAIAVVGKPRNHDDRRSVVPGGHVFDADQPAEFDFLAFFRVIPVIDDFVILAAGMGVFLDFTVKIGRKPLILEGFL
jgi:hypothetical protein